jgi:hypothetical protein
MMSYHCYHCDMKNYRHYFCPKSYYLHDMPAAWCDLSKVPKVAHYLLCPQGEMRQDYDQQPFQGDCGELPYCLRFRGAEGDCDAEVYGVKAYGGDEDSGNEDIPSPNNMGCSNPNMSSNTNSNYMVYMAYPNSSKGYSNRNTNHTKALQLRPRYQTSKLYT